MIAAISPAVRELIAEATIAREAARWSGRMSRIASPCRGPGVYAQTKRSGVSNGKVAWARWASSRPSSHARTAAVISRAADVIGSRYPRASAMPVEDRRA